MGFLLLLCLVGQAPFVTTSRPQFSLKAMLWLMAAVASLIGIAAPTARQVVDHWLHPPRPKGYFFHGGRPHGEGFYLDGLPDPTAGVQRESSSN
jgi:hypothetical protein